MSRARDLASNVTALGALADIQAMLTERNKMYFSFCPLGGSFAVTAGDVIDWETVYRIGVSA